MVAHCPGGIHVLLLQAPGGEIQRTTKHKKLHSSGISIITQTAAELAVKHCCSLLTAAKESFPSPIELS